jgi:uncharacterized protein
MRNSNGFWIIALIILVVDWYVFYAVKTVSQPLSSKARLAVFSVYWFITIASVLVVLGFPHIQAFQTNKIFRNYVFAILVGLFLAKLLAAAFFLIDDLRRVLVWTSYKITPKTGTELTSSTLIPRSSFLSWLGIGVGGTLFGTMMAGFSNKYNYKLKTINLHYPNLPEDFNGIKIVQISDVHSGSFQDKKAVEKGIEIILQQQPDLILFTGDLVNDRYEEMLEYTDVFSRLSAPLGVYSVLGNHDYGDYVGWPNAEAKAKNLDLLKDLQQKMGWRLLMNEHVVLQKNKSSIALLGIENWGAKGRFPKYGKMELAYAGTEKHPFKILLSHDPSHWDAEVRPQYPDIDLTLSGHTHGMQFGLENPYFKWSPVQWMYKQWAGLYQEGKQQLYVNRGFGFIGYPGRVGILPEITLLQLHKA